MNRISQPLCCIFSLHENLNQYRIFAGCYIGQETIARLITYDGVKQQLYTVHMNGYAEPETEITCNEARVRLSTEVQVLFYSILKI